MTVFLSFNCNFTQTVMSSLCSPTPLLGLAVCNKGQKCWTNWIKVCLKCRPLVGLWRVTYFIRGQSAIGSVGHIFTSAHPHTHKNTHTSLPQAMVSFYYRHGDSLETTWKRLCTTVTTVCVFVCVWWRGRRGLTVMFFTNLPFKTDTHIQYKHTQTNLKLWAQRQILNMQALTCETS